MARTHKPGVGGSNPPLATKILMKMFCITINNSHFDKIKELGYIPVGLGKNISNSGFLRDNTQNNISEKNPFYGEYTFHYWLWKNKKINQYNGWVGFCQYRKFWVKDLKNKNYKSFKELKENLLNEIPDGFRNFDSILGEPIFINQLRISKFFKKNFLKILKYPNLLFDKNKRNIKFHFDMMHGEGNLEKAISLLPKNDQNDFFDFVNSKLSFNPHNMFICKSPKILSEYYNSIFPWLKTCESKFGFNLEGYGLKRIYGFLAERYMSYWFNKYTRSTTLPILFKDISELN